MTDTLCPFCNVIDEEIILKNDLAFVRYDKFPVNKGHVLVIPYRHVSSYFNLTVEEGTALNDLTLEAKNLIDNEHEPDGYNLGTNIGIAAGQTVMHVHTHLIPRYDNDVGDPRGGVRGVIPEKQKY